MAGDNIATLRYDLAWIELEALVQRLAQQQPGMWCLGEKLILAEAQRILDLPRPLYFAGYREEQTPLPHFLEWPHR